MEEFGFWSDVLTLVAMFGGACSVVIFSTFVIDALAWLQRINCRSVRGKSERLYKGMMSTQFFKG